MDLSTALWRPMSSACARAALAVGERRGVDAAGVLVALALAEERLEQGAQPLGPGGGPRDGAASTAAGSAR